LPFPSVYLIIAGSPGGATKNKSKYEEGAIEMKRIVYILLIVMLGVAGYADNIQDKLMNLGIAIPQSKVEAIDFELEDLDGNKRSLSSYRGKVVFLNFWATWCGPCRIEMPSMQRVYDELKDEGFVIVAVNIREDKKLVKKFIDNNGLTFPVLLDKTGRVAGIYSARSIPMTYIIDREGNLVGRTIGAREWDTEEIQAVFREILEKGIEYDTASTGVTSGVAAEVIPVVNTTEEVKEIMIETFSWGFDISPPDVTIRKGDKVRLTVRGKNGTHGLAIPEYKISTGPLRKGEEEVFEFVVARSGMIKFECNLFCGGGHRGMKDFLMVVD
jgi:thiol-disulfide isomerase/thioredoxin